MITILIGALVGLVGGYLLYMNESSGRVGGTIASTCVGAFLGLMVFVLGGCILLDNIQMKERVIAKQELVQLGLGSDIGGDFFLGCGSISTDRSYYAYVKNNRDEMQLRGFHIRRSKIVFTEKQPKIEYYKLTPADKSIRLWWAIGDSDTRYRFYIPKGSIANNYNVDLK